MLRNLLENQHLTIILKLVSVIFTYGGEFEVRFSNPHLQPFMGNDVPTVRIIPDLSHASTTYAKRLATHP